MTRPSRGIAVRGIGLAAALALMVPGGIAVGYHSGGSGRPSKTFVAPYAQDYSDSFSGCGIAADCFHNAAADRTTGTLSVSGGVDPLLVSGPNVFVYALGGYAAAYAQVVAEDSLRRPDPQRGYTVTLHVDRAALSFACCAYLDLEVRATHSSCGHCYASQYFYLGPWEEGNDVVAYLDLYGVPAGTVEITATLSGYADTYSYIPETEGPSFDGAVTVTKVEVFR